MGGCSRKRLHHKVAIVHKELYLGRISVDWEVPHRRRPRGMGWGGATTRKGKRTRKLPVDGEPRGVLCV